MLLTDLLPLRVPTLPPTNSCPLPRPPLDPRAAYKSARLSVQRLQLDDMLAGTPFPVVLSPALVQPPAAAGEPVLAVTVVSVAGGARGRSYLPLLAVRWPLTVQLAISEGLVWAAHGLFERLLRAAAADGGGDAAPGGAVAAADMPVRIRLLAVETLRAQVSFQGDPLSRPRHVWRGVASLGRLPDARCLAASPRGHARPPTRPLATHRACAPLPRGPPLRAGTWRGAC